MLYTNLSIILCIKTIHFLATLNWLSLIDMYIIFIKLLLIYFLLQDELLENAKETGLPPPGPNDILGQALGKPNHPGHVVGQDRLVRPSLYFHQPSDDMKKFKEEIWEMVRKEMEDAATRQVMSPPTPSLIWVVIT